MNRKGFLLFEIVISIVVISTCLIYVARAYSSSQLAIKKSRELVRATTLVEKKLWELENAGEIEEGETEEDFQDKDFAVKTESARLEDSDLNIVDLKILKKDKPEEFLYSVSTYLKNKSSE